MGQTIYQVDAFTASSFSGNPAGVCMLDAPASDQWMQSVALEMNLSETAYLVPVGDGFHLRWFTPLAEVDLCGHATLASAHILWETGVLDPAQQARFHTRSGLLTAERRNGWIEMDFPADPPKRAAPSLDVERALGVTPKAIVRGRSYLLVEVESEQVVRALKPDLGMLGEASRGCIATSIADSGDYDFVSRMFAPGVGINEDPVTGSAHCLLGPYWGKKLGRSEMVGYQASARGGFVRVRPSGDRVVLGGQAVTVLRAELL